MTRFIERPESAVSLGLRLMLLFAVLGPLWATACSSGTPAGPASGGSEAAAGGEAALSSGGNEAAGGANSSGGAPAAGSGGTNAGGTSPSGGSGGVGRCPNLGIPDDELGRTGYPALLSEAGLYEADMATLAAGVRPFTPRFGLWADGATKRRWIFLPDGAQIDTTDMDYWQLPVGTRLYKEFSQGDQRIETRLLHKQENGAWWRIAYQWRDDQMEADAVPCGVENASGTEHDIPNGKNCGECHLRMPDKVLGFSAIQLAHDAEDQTEWTLTRLAEEGRLTTAAPASLELPGNAVEQAALGYMHANCGHCHNPRSTVSSRISIELWLTTATLGSVTETPSYLSTVDHGIDSEDGPPLPLTVVIDPGSPETSSLFVRMTNRGEPWAMPPLGTELVDDAGRAAVEAWILSLQ